MSSKIHVVLEGLPERVQEIADVLDRAFPAVMNWRRSAEHGRDHTVRLEGDAERSGGLQRHVQLTNQTAASGKAWKLSPVGCASRSRFCASRSKNLQS